ncbi:unnamed protein product [Calypogeia fissa]
MVEVLPRGSRRAHAQCVETSSSDMDQGSSPVGSQQGNSPDNGVVEQNGEEVEWRPPVVIGGPHLPQYLQNVFFADHHSSAKRLVEELGALSARAFCEDFIADTLRTLTSHSTDLFCYVHWLARTVSSQQETIESLTSQLDQVSTTDDYDRLVKEKASWINSWKQLEEELRDEMAALEKVTQERDEVRATIAKDTEIIKQQLQSLFIVNQELSGVRESIEKLISDKGELSAKVLQLQTEAIDFEKRLGEITDERDEALQDIKNSQSMTESILQRINLVESKLEAPADPSAPHKRPRAD